MSEKAVAFGLNNNLIGVISEPAKNNVKQDAPAVIILNAGLIHKVGPYRLSVDIAREISSYGFYVMRFDLSGVGDSNMGLKNGSRWDMATRDVRHAMKLLSDRYDLDKFILIGLCSGSDNSHRISLNEERVVGTIHLDGFSYKNFMYYIYYYVPRLFYVSCIKKIVFDSLIFILRKINKSMIKSYVTSVEYSSLNRDFPMKKQAEEDFKVLVSRGVKLLYIYNGMGQTYNSYKNQLRDSLNVDFKNCLELEYYPYAQHTYATINSRDKVISRISEWVNRNFC